MQALFNELQPALIQVLSVLIGAALLYLSNLVRQKTGMEIEARHREALHSALMTGVMAGLRGLTNSGDPATVIGQKNMLIDKAVAYAKDSVPDAMKKLKPKDFVLRQLAESKLNEALRKSGGM